MGYHATPSPYTCRCGNTSGPVAVVWAMLRRRARVGDSDASARCAAGSRSPLCLFHVIGRIRAAKADVGGTGLSRFDRPRLEIPRQLGPIGATAGGERAIALDRPFRDIAR